MIRGRLVLSLVLAAAAFGLPWVTHFADGGLSIALHLFWIALAIAALVTQGRQGLWLLVGAPLALYWPGLLIWWMAFGSLRMF